MLLTPCYVHFWGRQLNNDDFATKFSLLFMLVVQAFFFNMVSGLSGATLVVPVLLTLGVAM